MYTFLQEIGTYLRSWKDNSTSHKSDSKNLVYIYILLSKQCFCFGKCIVVLCWTSEMSNYCHVPERPNDFQKAVPYLKLLAIPIIGHACTYMILLYIFYACIYLSLSKKWYYLFVTVLSLGTKTFALIFSSSNFLSKSTFVISRQPV